MRKFTALLAGILLSTAALADEIIIDGNSVVKKKLQQVYNIYGDVDLLPTVRVTYDKPRVVIKMVYPKIESPTEDENIDTFNDLTKNMIDTLADDYKKQVADLKDLQAGMSKSELHNNLTIDFASATINTNEAPIISVRFSAQGYVAGMAHPYHTFRTLNYDLDNGSTIALTDLFDPETNYLEVLSEYSQRILSRKLTDKQMIADGTAAKEENFKHWNIKPYGLMITFDEAQVAPYVNGPQTVLIPFSAIKGLLAKNSALSDCLKHRVKRFKAFDAN